MSVPGVVQNDPSLNVRRIGNAAGAEVVDVDLSQPIDEKMRAAIYDAFLAHHLLVFREQTLSEEAQVAFTLNFGELEGHVIRLQDGEKAPLLHTVSNLDAQGQPTSKPYSVGNYFWHTDKSYHAVPSLSTLLYAVTLPPSGGDTLFANTKLGFDALDDAEKDRYAGLKVVHSWEASRKNTGNKPATEDEKRERPPVTHPLIRTHPDTGEKLLYMGSHCSHVEGMDYEEGRALLADLLERSTQEQFVYRHQWKPGDLVMWDNRCLLHRADSNYEMDRYPRILHRTVLRGTRPF